MRWLLLLGIIALAVVARAEDVAVDLEDKGEVNLLDDLDEDALIDVASLVSGLFEFSDEDDFEHDMELEINRESRAMEDESALEQKAVDPADQARYNKFIDTFFRRLNADARAAIDPLEVGIVSKNKKKAKSGKKGAAKKDAKEDDKKKGRRKDKPSKKPKKKTKKTRKGNNNKNKKQKKGRHPKSLDLEGEDEGEDDSAEDVAVEEGDDHHIVARDAENIVDEALERQERSVAAVENVEVEESDVAASRSRPKGGKKNGNKKRKGGNKKKKGGKKKSKNSKKSKKSKRSTKKKGARTSRATVSGIATLVRQGDVSVVDRKDGKELRTEFSMGPVTLKVNRRFGSGKNALVRSAEANSPQLTGKMHLAVAANGKAKITKFNIMRPSVVTTKGSINKNENDVRKGNNFIENSIGRISPIAAKKLKLMARDVLRATETKN